MHHLCTSDQTNVTMHLSLTQQVAALFLEQLQFLNGQGLTPLSLPPIDNNQKSKTKKKKKKGMIIS